MYQNPFRCRASATPSASASLGLGNEVPGELAPVGTQNGGVDTYLCEVLLADGLVALTRSAHIPIGTFHAGSRFLLSLSLVIRVGIRISGRRIQA